MLIELLRNCPNFVIYENGIEISKPDAKEILIATMSNSYSGMSYLHSDENILLLQRNSGIWIEFDFERVVTHHENKFSKLLVNIKPKQDWLTFHKHYDGKYQGKSLQINLATKTTSLYNYLMSK